MAGLGNDRCKNFIRMIEVKLVLIGNKKEIDCLIVVSVKTIK